MARLLTTGFESRLFTTSKATNGEAQETLVTGTVTSDTTHQWDGSVCIACAGGAENCFKREAAGSSGTTYYGQTVVRLSTVTPTSDMPVFEFRAGSSIKVFVVKAGELALYNTKIEKTIIATGFKPEAEKHYILELKVLVAISGSSTVALRVRDETGVVVYESADVETEITTSATHQWKAGVVTAGGSGTVYISHLIINDSTGEKEKSWVGPQKVVLLKPEHDESRVGFTTGTGGTTELYKCLANFPPIGKAAGSATATSQIKDVENNTTGKAEIATRAYTASIAEGGGGISLKDKVKVLCGMGRFGNSSANARTFGVKVGGGEERQTLSSAPTAAGTEPTSWETLVTKPIYEPTLTPEGEHLWGPNIFLYKKTASTDAAMFDMAGVYVSYEPYVKPTSYVRQFNGTSDAIYTASGGITATEAITLAALVKIEAGTGYRNILTLLGTGKLLSEFFYAESGELGWYQQSPEGESGWSGAGFKPTDGWALLVVTKAAGITKPKFYKYVFSTKTLTSGEGSTATGNRTIAIDSVQIGRTSTEYFKGRMAALGVWNIALTESQVKALFESANLEAWKLVGSPQALWLLGQSSPSEGVKDLIGSANQTSVTGTTVISDVIPIPYRPEGTRWNLAIQPNFEGEEMPWIPHQGKEVIERQSVEKHDGKYALKVSTPGLVEYEGIETSEEHFVPKLSTSQITFSAWVKVPSGVELTAAVQERSKGSFVRNLFGDIIGNGEWQRLSETFTFESGADALSCVLYLSGIGERVFYVDSLLVESGNKVLSYFDGSTTLAGYSTFWEGAANNSISVALPAETKHEYSTSVSETLSPSQTVVRAVTVKRTPSETFSTSDVIIRVTGVTRKPTETLSTSDNAARNSGGFTRAIAQTLSTSDTPSIAGHVYAKTIQEILLLSDAVKRVFAGARGQSESLSTSDLPKRAISPSRATSEALSTSETPSRLTILARVVAQVLTTSENPSRLSNFFRGAPNILSTSDIVLTGQSISKAVSETIITSEATKRQGVFGRSPNEALTVSDSTKRSTSTTQRVTEAIVTSETTKRFAVAIRNLTETLSTSDATARAKGSFHGVSETLVTSDEPKRVAPGSFIRNVAQNNVLTETVTRLFNAARSIFDLVTGTDSPKREVFTIYHGEHPITIEAAISEVTRQGGRDEVVLKTRILEPRVIETDEDNLVFELYDDSLIFDRETEDLILNTVMGVEASKGKYEDHLVLDVHPT